MSAHHFRSPEAGFEVSWDDHVFEPVLDAADERLVWAIGSFLDERPAAALLLLATGLTAGAGRDDAGHGSPGGNDAGQAGAAPFVFLATDGRPIAPEVFATWDWAAITRSHASDCVRRGAATTVMADQQHWHGFPMLQLTWVSPPADPDTAFERASAYLFTPQQTFTMVIDHDRLDDSRFAAAVKDFAESFHLLPRKREGRREQAHVRVRGPFLVTEDEFVDLDIPF